MYILFNKDGSINKINLTDFIQQGSNNVNKIFIAVKDRDNENWAVTGYFGLPNGDIESLTATDKVDSIEGVEYNGWEVSISANVTQYEGDVNFSVSLLNVQGHVLNSYEGVLVINPAVVIPDETTITRAQYEALLQYVLSRTIGKADVDHVILVVDALPENLAPFQNGQIFLLEPTRVFYKLSNGSLEEYDIFNPGSEFVTVEDHDYIIPPEDR